MRLTVANLANVKYWKLGVRGCSHRGVYYVQGNDRHSLDFTEAQKLCELLGASLANATQMVRILSTQYSTTY
uniref:Link domain-containing protein n=1 Tax=Pygocentrus nattereri TaxID=42514 RepID=A0AAR2L6Q7_PYGNA